MPRLVEWHHLWVAEELSQSHPTAVFSNDSAPESTALPGRKTPGRLTEGHTVLYEACHLNGLVKGV